MDRYQLITLLRESHSIQELNEHKKDIFSVMPSLSIMENYNQNNHYHQYDLWIHSLHVVMYLEKDLSDDMVYLAALIHDIGKPSSRCRSKRENDHESHYYGHPEISAEITEKVLIPEMEKIGILLSDEEKMRLLFYVRHHDDPIADKLSKLKKWIETEGKETVHNWMELEVADAKAHVIYPKVLKRITVCQKLAEETDKENKKMHGMIATWRMAKEGIEAGSKTLEKGGKAADAIEQAIRAVEDYPYYKSVGYGGLPNEEGILEMDAGYMDGDTLSVGAVSAIQDFANPVSVARKLSTEKVNNCLTANGAAKYAKEKGFEEKKMLTERAKRIYEKKKAELAENNMLRPYDGHDTVGMVCLDDYGTVTAATSTSGLFMKRSGRVGDSPFVGSGYYADSEAGGATATGLGEDIMKGCISYEIVRLMKEGKTPQEACEKAVNELDASLKKRRGNAGDISVVAMNNKGEWGCATNIDGFSFVVTTDDKEPVVYLANRKEDGHTVFEVASKEWLEEYMYNHSAEVE